GHIDVRVVDLLYAVHERSSSERDTEVGGGDSRMRGDEAGREGEPQSDPVAGPPRPTQREVALRGIRLDDVLAEPDGDVAGPARSRQEERELGGLVRRQLDLDLAVPRQRGADLDPRVGSVGEVDVGVAPDVEVHP